MPTVSAVIPVYNARDVIAETIETVLAQTWKALEIIVVDDGSTDGSEKVIKEFGNRVRYFRQDNAGVARSRNRGISESTGKYIALLDHDDLWHPTKIEKQVRVLDEHPEAGMVITDVMHIGPAGTPLGLLARGYNPSDPFYAVFVQGYVPTPSATMIRKSIFDAAGRFDEAFASAGLDDHELWPRIAAICRIENVAEALTYHRNQNSKAPHIALEHRALLVSKLLNHFGHVPEKRRFLLKERAAYLADWGKHLIQEGNIREGRASLFQGLMLSTARAFSLKTGLRCTSRIIRSYLVK